MVFVMKFQAAAMSRSDIPEDQRVDFSLYVDEFQNFSTDSFATIMSEARKYHLNLIVANQFTTQLTQEIRDAVFGNMGTIVAFRIGQNDVESLSQYFQPTFDGDDLLRVPNYNTIVRTLIGGVPTNSFSMVTLPPLGTPNPRLFQALKQLTAAKYGRPKDEIEKEINQRMKTIGERPPLGGGPAAPGLPARAGGGPAAGQPAGARPAAGQQSFLDEWLNKRKTVAGAGAAQRRTPPPSAAAPPDTVRPADRGRNISSNQLEQNEVHKIAAELKQELDVAGPPKQAAAPAATPAPAPAAAAPEQDAKPAKKTEDTIHLQSGGEEGDTIFIDREGSFHTADELDKKPGKSDQPA
jgi:hypothetical protein